MNDKFTNMAHTESAETGEVYDEMDLVQMRFLQEQAALTKSPKFLAQSHPNFDGVHCVNPDCEDDLPEARIKLGRIYCVSCQEIIDKKSKR